MRYRGVRDGPSERRLRARVVTGSLARFQSRFVDALFDRENDLALNAQPAFAVYRNTVMKGCIDALEANYPSVARLVGPDWFRAAAAMYVHAEPPGDGRLLNYGESFAAFLAGFGPARDLPYLADVARLDRFWIEAHTAADAAAVDAASLAPMAPEALAGLRVAPHPAARWRWFADAPVYSIWQNNRGSHASTGEIVWHGEGALLVRPVDVVAWLAVDEADCAFLDACAAGRLLGDAAAEALAVRPDTDVAGLLARLLRAGALVSLFEESQP